MSSEELSRDSVLRNDPLNESFGTLEILCKRPLFFGRLRRQWSWRLFLDGKWVLDLPLGIPVRQPVQPGIHVVRIWTQNGDNCSNDLELNFEAGRSRSLICTRLPQAKGLASLRSLRDTIHEGGTRVGGIRVEEVPPLRLN